MSRLQFFLFYLKLSSNYKYIRNVLSAKILILYCHLANKHTDQIILPHIALDQTLSAVLL